MSIQKRFDEFKTEYEKAIKTIKSYQENEDIGKFVNWLLETDINPYSFFDDEYADLFSNASGFASLCRIIHHALVDDGDVTFVSIEGQPKMLFKHQSEIEIKSFIKRKVSITVVDGKKSLKTESVRSNAIVYRNYKEFIRALDKKAALDLKRSNMYDKKEL